ncbi:hypothetical protein [Tsukamurella soli]|uniref:Uncharacterized protein n=1 Tax=Tsukamurella soli TaxID=644556 RepID=A0ABP8JJ52_9ACTN
MSDECARAWDKGFWAGVMFSALTQSMEMLTSLLGLPEGAFAGLDNPICINPYSGQLVSPTTGMEGDQ